MSLAVSERGNGKVFFTLSENCESRDLTIKNF
jgi:hypothetical protein